MKNLSSLNAIAQFDAQVLILGSIPGQQSLMQHQYYAHPRNVFWKIMAHLFDVDLPINYAEKLLLLQQHKLALWDVIQSCQRQGSLDSKINKTSILCNDFVFFFSCHPQIKHIFFNGSRAYQEYHQRVKPSLATHLQSIPCTRLPSTSPAMASLTFEEKMTFWLEIKQILAE